MMDEDATLLMMDDDGTLDEDCHAGWMMMARCR
jgi:hypothetical protein